MTFSFSHLAVTVVVTVTVLTLTLPVACNAARLVAGMMVSTSETEVAVAPPDDTGVIGGNGAELVVGTDGEGLTGVDAADGAAGVLVLDSVDVALATVTNSVDTDETVMVVVGSSAGIGLLAVVGELEVAAVGVADMASEVVVVEVLEVVGAGVAVEAPKVWTAAAPVRVVKPPVGPLKVADIVTKTTDTALVG